jgi:threonine/homoserine/homoserine lactone efflux protein
MPAELLLAGVGLGFLVAVPVGPIGLICIQRTLSENRISGYAAGLGAATADAVYASIAGLGLAFVSDFFLSQRFWMGLLGGVFLCLYGYHTFQKRPKLAAEPVRLAGLAGSFLSTLILTLANPLNILLFAGVFATVGVAGVIRGSRDDLLLGLGVFVGSGVWWLTLTTIVSVLRSRFNETALRWASRISGVLIIAAGAFVLLSLLSALAS